MALDNYPNDEDQRLEGNGELTEAPLDTEEELLNLDAQRDMLALLGTNPDAGDQYEPEGNFDEVHHLELTEGSFSDSDDEFELESKNPNRDAASIYMNEVGERLLTKTGEQNLGRKLEYWKQTCLMFLLLIPSARKEFCHQHYEDRDSNYGHPRITRFGNDPLAEQKPKRDASKVDVHAYNYPPELFKTIQGIEKVGDMMQSTITPEEISEMWDALADIEAQILVTEGQDEIDYWFYSAEAFLPKIQDKVQPSTLLYCELFFQLIRFNIDYSYINTLLSKFTEQRNAIRSAQNKMINLLERELLRTGTTKAQIHKATEGAIKSNRPLKMDLKRSTSLGCELARKDIKLALDTVGCSFEIFRAASSCVAISSRHAQDVINELTKFNLRLVLFVSKKWKNERVEFLDFVQEGNIGLMRSVEKFDYRRGYKFSTYGHWWIRQAINQALQKMSRTIRIPVHILEFYKRIEVVSKEYATKHGRNPSTKYLAKKLKVKEETIKNALVAESEPISTDLPLSSEDENGSLINLFKYDGDDIMPSPEHSQHANDLREVVHECLATLSPREATILKMRHGIDCNRTHTLDEVSKQFDVTRERIRQVEGKAKKRFRLVAEGRLSDIHFDRGREKEANPKTDGSN